MSIAFGTRRAEWIKLADVPAAARRRRPRPLRGLRPLLPLAVRAPLQLRADVGPPGRARSPRAASSRALLFDAMDYDARASPTARTPTSSPTRPATRRWASTRCGRCATSSRASASPALLPADAKRPRCASRTCSASAATRSTRDAALPRSSARRPSTGTRRRRRRSSGSRPAPRASASRARSASPSARATTTATNAPRVHVVEGEGGLTPGRVAEALAAAGTASLDNVVFHVDWNQASIDSNRVCREATSPATTCSGRRWSSSTSTTGT